MIPKLYNKMCIRDRSNTEPIIRVYSEASTPEEAEEIGQKIMKVIEDLAK